MKTPARSLPPPVSVSLSASVRDYWLERVAQVQHDLYAGVTMKKFPEDLRVYEHLLWISRPDTVIEIGASSGGSALWFRDRLRTLAAYGRIDEPRVVTVDIRADRARRRLEEADPGYAETIAVIDGDVCDPGLAREVERELRPGARCLVVEDSAHTYDTTEAALNNYSRFVHPGGFFIVEDGCVDIDSMRLSDRWPRGVLPAIHRWLESSAGSRFEVRRDLECYGISCHPMGFLQRTF